MMKNLPKATRSWPLLSISAGAGITAGLSYARNSHPATGAVFLTIGSICFGAWLVTEIIWLFTHIDDERKDEGNED